ncbi:hypothetical protein FB567DRAFT_320887 [Paraphoma chrysanthemicola]|uniref:Uncharacterized protein n=1 Tax=Paraphoma chrysanthemicola TaxID=798071 RepID=A0A8K0VZY2_9PLEO|nr:hypothetical protein FB567DRAFT_320887 [Paraphoma chrysanthemicola]
MDLTRRSISIVIHGMLEELQTIFHEEGLRRQVEVGHEFECITEAKASPELPHGESIVIGMVNTLCRQLPYLTMALGNAQIITAS